MAWKGVGTISATGPRKGDSRSGLTLLELVVVILIIATITAVVAPRFVGTFTTVGLKSSAARVATTIRYVRHLAVKERLYYRLHCDELRNSYWVSAEKDPEHAPQVFAPVADSFVGEGRLSGGVSFRNIYKVGTGDDHAEFIAFSPKGRIEKAYLYLENEQTGQIFTVVTYPFGRVTTYDHEFGPE